jgi:hypothetical protein
MKIMNRTEKTVYVLGAGFSKPAGGPSQAEVMERIWKLKGPSSALKRKTKLKKFLRAILNVDERKVTLEDIYTPIDRCLADGITLRSGNEAKLTEIRDDLGYLISCAIQESFNEAASSSSSYANKFARYLVEKAAVRAEKAANVDSAKEATAYDPVSVISLNWDILLDNAINDELRRRHPTIKSDYAEFGVVDYCCYISSIDKNDRRVRSGLWTLGCRGYNIKLLKLHGSMNWLQCPNCQRLFVGFYEKHVIMNYEDPQLCRHCKNHGHDVKWRGAMVMPTFLKDLSNFQIKLIWQNASVELMEARKIVFVGYSLPSADFEFRQMLSRMVHPDAKIEVYLWDAAPTFADEEKRFRDFFSRHDVHVYGKGATEFVSNL